MLMMRYRKACDTGRRDQGIEKESARYVCSSEGKVSCKLFAPNLFYSVFFNE